MLNVDSMAKISHTSSYAAKTLVIAMMQDIDVCLEKYFDNANVNAMSATYMIAPVTTST